MTNTTIDLIRLPIDKNGDMIIDYNEARNIYETYKQVFPDRQAIMMPANLSIWEDLDLETLKFIDNYLKGIIEIKEKEQNDN